MFYLNILHHIARCDTLSQVSPFFLSNLRPRDVCYFSLEIEDFSLSRFTWKVIAIAIHRCLIAMCKLKCREACLTKKNQRIAQNNNYKCKEEKRKRKKKEREKEYYLEISLKLCTYDYGRILFLKKGGKRISLFRFPFLFSFFFFVFF